MHRCALLTRSSFYSFLLLLLALLMPAAQERQQETTPPPKPSAEDEALRKAAGAPVDPKTYLIGAEDILQIKVWREADLSGPVGVRPDGKITLPLIGDLQASGLTPEKLAAVITEGFSKFVTSPEVMVQVAAVNSKKYFVAGEVQRPGSYPLVVPTTVLEAISIAGSLREYANAKNILILRGPKRYKFNYKDVIKGKNLGQNIYLESGDHIIVP
jgi:polysaccharide export outer membrane protein